jgi:hypothetical protein
MAFLKDRDSKSKRNELGQSSETPGSQRRSIIAWPAAIAVVTAVALSGQQQLPPPRLPTPITYPGGNPMPDANDLMKMHESKAKRQKFDEINTARMKQIGSDSAALLKLASDVKTEVDKNGSDALSTNTVQKVENIEVLARSVKEKMKLTVGPS